MDVERRLGIMGGTFDPIHFGHLVAAQETAAVLNLERVLFVPTAQPPHKVGELVSPVEHRVTMVSIAIANNPRFELSTIELERGGLSYTVDTARELRRRHPHHELYFIIGMDSLAELPSWHDPEGILEIARIAAVYRSGWEVVDLEELDRQVRGAAERVSIVPIPGLDISSTDLRDRIIAGRPLRYLMPDPIVAYIAEQALFRD
jgi:nicotinate-nucleotide adenylyltransferase